MNKRMYVGMFGASLLAAILSAILIGILILIAQEFPGLHRELASVYPFLFFISVLGVLQFVVVQIVFTFILILRMWSAIQDGYARTTPGKAIGFLFIPFFNIYWIFQVWGGFPKDYNNYVERYQLQLPRLGSGLYVTYPILILLTVIPFLGILAAVISPFLFLALTARTCDAINKLADAVLERQRHFAEMNVRPQAVAATAKAY